MSGCDLCRWPGAVVRLSRLDDTGAVKICLRCARKAVDFLNAYNGELEREISAENERNGHVPPGSFATGPITTTQWRMRA